MSRIITTNQDQSTETAQVAGDTQTRFEQIQTEISQGALLLDVRTPEEFAEGYFVGAVNFDSAEIANGKLPEVDKDTKIYLHCRSGMRAGQVKSWLEQAGFNNVESLGGLAEIIAMGGELIQGVDE